jgi:F0F1-type ATP synthase membrane subunit b/b'
MFTIDGTLIVTLVSFLLFMLTLKILFFDPIAQVKGTREQTLESNQQLSLDITEQGQLITGRCHHAIAEARQKAHGLIAEKREQAKAEAAQKVASERDAALSSQTDAMQRMQESSEQVYQMLQMEKAALVEIIVHKLTRGTGRCPVSSSSALR